ncbi:protein lifeguard 4 [Ammospiza maritima maritima]
MYNADKRHRGVHGPYQASSDSELPLPTLEPGAEAGGTESSFTPARTHTERERLASPEPATADGSISPTAAPSGTAEQAACAAAAPSGGQRSAAAAKSSPRAGFPRLWKLPQALQSSITHGQSAAPATKPAPAIDALGRSAGRPARCHAPRKRRRTAAMAAVAGEQRYPRSSIEDDFNYGSNVASASVHIRMAFLRKVYSILSVQVLLTTVTSAIFLYSTGVQAFVHDRPALLLISGFGSLAVIVALTLYRHQHPVNLYLLFGFTLLEALTVAITVSFYDVSIVLQAFILTTAVFLGLTAYTLQSKRDFSKFGAGLFACLWILIISGFLRLFFYSETVELVFAAAGALLFCGFIIYDTHLLMHKLSPEEYILAAINLYLDIINLFLHLLRFLEAFNKK